MTNASVWRQSKNKSKWVQISKIQQLPAINFAAFFHFTSSVSLSLSWGLSPDQSEGELIVHVHFFSLELGVSGLWWNTLGFTELITAPQNPCSSEAECVRATHTHTHPPHNCVNSTPVNFNASLENCPCT